MTAPPASLRALLAGAIDYAGLFPPARLEMRAAVEQYESHCVSDVRWALGRFVVPATRLEELADARRAMAGAKDQWRMSALLGSDPAADVERILAFNEVDGGLAVVDSVEAKVSDGGEASITALAATIPSSMTAFVEIPSDGDIERMIHAIAKARLNAKIRTGGVTAQQFPQPVDVVRFIRRCVEHDVPFKATAGLHHPIRADYRLTYEPDAQTGRMYGFLNLLVATSAMRAGCNDDRAQEILLSEDADAFRFDDAGLRWGDLSLDTSRVRDARARLILSFGSCSFAEPIADLRRLGLI
jgi:hypothetical protein